MLSNLQPLVVVDSKERKRKRDRELYARMDPDKKAERVKRIQENRKKKAATTSLSSTQEQQVGEGANSHHKTLYL